MMVRNSEATQERLLDAARRHFAVNGFERTTVRDIAAEAGVNVALISRYFGGKDELFARAVAIDLALPDLSGVPKAEIGRHLIEHFFKRWEGREADDLLRVLVRTAATNSRAAEKILAILHGQILPLVARLAGEKGAQHRASLIATQILGLAYCRYVLNLGDDQLDPAQAVAAIGATLQRYLFEDS
ncbi:MULTISPECIES: TetR family transcriptional regulator [unclassified Devosia]|uniref:TetR/AcrR family transcriptional regulator n=1 Tax=unclassified Devosia TaxID=196773 RepID=UPI00155810A5|nr:MULTISPECIES: TetR family transcriptional regulator [unclassified Devosia]